MLVNQNDNESDNADEPDLADSIVAVVEDVASAVTGDEPTEAAETPPEPVVVVDPWAPPVPRPLASVHRNLKRGRAMHNAAERTLRRYAERNRDDARVFLLLGHGYTTRGWRPDALERYERAYAIDPNARHDPQMRENLVRLASHRNVAGKAQRMVRDIYGNTARTTIDEVVADSSLTRDERQRLTTFRDTL